MRLRRVDEGLGGIGVFEAVWLACEGLGERRRGDLRCVIRFVEREVSGTKACGQIE